VTTFLMFAQAVWHSHSLTGTCRLFLQRTKSASTAIVNVIGDEGKINSLTRQGIRYLRKGETPLDRALLTIKSSSKSPPSAPASSSSTPILPSKNNSAICSYRKCVCDASAKKTPRSSARCSRSARKEKENLQTAAGMYITTKQDHQPFDPAAYGFDFSVADIESYLKRVHAARLLKTTLNQDRERAKLRTAAA
jgi:hypothetical protein